jgi:endogenous inhibitor of DNA gyrase (YacG/DUF329 family)
MAIVSCPTCQRPVEWSEASKWRPFCSERCKLLDLGAWMSEQRAIPGEELPTGVDAEDSAGDHSLPRH